MYLLAYFVLFFWFICFFFFLQIIINFYLCTAQGNNFLVTHWGWKIVFRTDSLTTTAPRSVLIYNYPDAFLRSVCHLMFISPFYVSVQSTGIYRLSKVQFKPHHIIRKTYNNSSFHPLSELASSEEAVTINLYRECFWRFSDTNISLFFICLHRCWTFRFVVCCGWCMDSVWQKYLPHIPPRNTPPLIMVRH